MIRAMMTQQLQASILSAPIAQIDRRALSEAWYSALHLARGHAPTPAERPETRCSARELGKAKTNAANRRKDRSAPPIVRPRRVSGQGGALLARVVERRAPRSPLARRIESVFLDPRARAERSTFTIGRDGARVHVVLQSTGDCVRLIAVCAPANREIVARALAQARYALASRGCLVDDGEVREVPCS
jgi:hypothetical protein